MSKNSAMMHLTYLATGLIFGLGLVISGMSTPAKVLDFLDIAGKWDPSLIFVMLGAAATTMLGYTFVFKKGSPKFSDVFELPTEKAITKRIIIGPMIFGIGWGLAGYCPGPAITALSGGGAEIVLFSVFMFCGMSFAKKLIAAKDL